MVSVATLSARNLYGTWSGLLKVTPQHSLRLVLHISEDSVTLDSPDQNAFGIKGELKFISADSVAVEVNQLQMNYSGRRCGDSIVGQFRQGLFNVPLTMSRGATRLNRPQTPCPPFPYTTEEVTVKTPDASLAGTLTIPQAATQETPVVILVSGSGLQNRDEEIFEHRPFAVIADYLAKNGIASLRYDDRGYGESKGDSKEATTADFAADAKAITEYLRKLNRFSKVGMIGHSEGGMIAYMLGSEPEILDFVVSVAGPSVTGAKINAFQNTVALRAAGIDSITAGDFGNALLKANRFRLSNPPLRSVSEALLHEIYPQADQSPVTRQLASTISATLIMPDIDPWMEYFLKFDPAPYLNKLRVPAMIIYGEKDCQVPASLNYQPALLNAPEAEIHIYPELNHLMQHAKTGAVEEYREIEETFSEEVLSDIVTFIREATSYSL